MFFGALMKVGTNNELLLFCSHTRALPHYQDRTSEVGISFDENYS